MTHRDRPLKGSPQKRVRIDVTASGRAEIALATHMKEQRLRGLLVINGALNNPFHAEPGTETGKRTVDKPVGR